MGLGCGAQCLKVTLITFNIIFWIGGATVLGLGIWMAVDEDAFDTLDIINPEGMDYTAWKATVYTMIAVGAFIFLVASFGTMGACCENKCMLMTYSVLSSIALAAEITCAVLAIVYKDDINAELEKEMYNDVVSKYTTVGEEDNSYVATWNNFQTKMKCCGSYNFTDWHANKNYGPLRNPPIPWTCCTMKEINKPPKEEDVVDINKCYDEGRLTDPNKQPTFTHLNPVGCHEALVVWVEDKSAIIYGVMFGVAAIQLLGIIFGCILWCEIKDSQAVV